MHTFSHQRCNLEYRCYLFWSLLGPILLLLIASSLPAVITVGGHFLKCIFDCNASKVFLFQSTALKRLKECQLEVQFEAAQPSFSCVATQYRGDRTFQLSGSEFWMQAKHEAEHTKGCLCVDAMCLETTFWKLSTVIFVGGSIFFKSTLGYIY